MPEYKLSYTASEIDAKLGEIDNLAKKSEIPTKTSQLTNNSGFLTSIPSEYVTEAELNTKGYLTEHQDLSNYALKEEIPEVPVLSVNGKTGNVNISAEDVGALPSTTIIPTVPTNVSAFTNDAGYLTEHQSLADYAKAVDLENLSSNVSYIDATDNENVENPDGVIVIDVALSDISTNPVQNKVVTEKFNELSAQIGDDPVSTQIVSAISQIRQVPSTTTSDNGKFLRVIDGQASWTSVSNAEEATF